LQPDVTALRKALASVAASAATIDEVPGLGVVVRTGPDAALEVLTALRDAGYTYLLSCFGIDTGEGVEAVYHVRSLSRDGDVRVRVSLPYGGTVRSAFHVYPGVLYPERELAEMFGLVLEGHPNPKRLLTTEDVPQPLLLKSSEVRHDADVHRREVTAVRERIEAAAAERAAAAPAPEADGEEA
jgi:NADH:ubiquinone oxidoreductase subunit C